MNTSNKTQDNYKDSRQVKCRHYRAMVDNNTCKIGITFTHAGLCFGRSLAGVNCCKSYSPPTTEEFALQKARDDQLSQWINKANSDIANQTGFSGITPCPKCGKEIHWSRAGFSSGHVHAFCSTQGCIWWMQ